MSVLKAYFDESVNQCSPVLRDYFRSVEYDEDGNEFVTWKEVDYAALQTKNGVIQDWSLDNLLKAGINPDFPISTGYVNRLSGIDELQRIEVEVDSIIESNENKIENE